MLKIIVIVSIIWIAVSTANAADFRPAEEPYAIQLTGTIERGDTTKLAKLLSAEQPIFSLMLASPGGDVQEAIRLAALVREFRLQISVAPRYNCASACFFIFLAGSGRVAAGVELEPARVKFGRIGLHRPYLVSPTDSPASQNRQLTLMLRVREYLVRNQVPNSLIDLMMSRPSNAIYWLKSEELELLGDFSPDLEELYIAKCNYDRGLNAALSMATYVQDKPSVQRLQSVRKTVNQCIVTLQSEGYAAAKQKILKGWLPKADI